MQESVPGPVQSYSLDKETAQAFSVKKHVLYLAEASAFISMTTFPVCPKAYWQPHSDCRKEIKSGHVLPGSLYGQSKHTQHICNNINFQCTLFNYLSYLTCITSIHLQHETTEKPSHMVTSFNRDPHIHEVHRVFKCQQRHWSNNDNFGCRLTSGLFMFCWKVWSLTRNCKWKGNHKGQIDSMGGGWEWNGEKGERQRAHLFSLI